MNAESRNYLQSFFNKKQFPSEITEHMFSYAFTEESVNTLAQRIDTGTDKSGSDSDDYEMEPAEYYDYNYSSLIF